MHSDLIDRIIKGLMFFENSDAIRFPETLTWLYEHVFLMKTWKRSDRTKSTNSLIKQTNISVSIGWNPRVGFDEYRSCVLLLEIVKLVVYMTRKVSVIKRFIVRNNNIQKLLLITVASSFCYFLPNFIPK